MRSVIAVAALMACSGAWAELTKEQRATHQRIGECAGLYLQAPAATLEKFDENMDRMQEISAVSKGMAAELSPTDAWVAGSLHADKLASVDISYTSMEKGSPDKAEIWRLTRIIELDCESL